MVWKKTESKSSWTLFFSRPFLPHVWDSVFFRAPKLASALTFPSATFQHQGSGYSFRGAKGSLYWFCPIQIPSKFWGWSNLCTILLATPLSFGEFRGGKIWTIPFVLGWNVLDTTISGGVKVIPGGGEFRTLFSEFWGGMKDTRCLFKLEPPLNSLNTRSYRVTFLTGPP